MFPDCLVGIFCVCSYFFFALLIVRLFPCGYGKEKQAVLRRRFPYPVTKIAHRGGCLIGPENTLFTFRRALVEGDANALELDVHESKDGEIVVCHDANLGRICGSGYIDKNVSDIVVRGNLDCLPQLLRKIPLDFPSLSRGYYYEADDFVLIDETTRLCLLSEVFDAFPDVVIHIDIKSEGLEFITRVMKMIERYGRESKTIVGSSNWRNFRNIYNFFKSEDALHRKSLEQKRSRFRIFAGPVEYAVVHFAYYLGVLPFLPLGFDVFSIPIFTKLKRSQFESYFMRFFTYFLNSPTLWSHLQRRGILVIGWVLNDFSEFEEASQWPLNGIMSDDPIALKAFFASRNLSNKMNLLE